MAETRTRRRASARAQESEEANDEAAKRKAEAEARRSEKEKERDEAKAKREAEREEREKKRADEKAERDKKKAEEKEAKEKEREEARKNKEQEKVAARAEAIERGDLIFATFDRERLPADVASEDIQVTYSLAQPKKEEVAQRALSVIRDLQRQATEVPYPGKELADEYGGGTVQWVAFFGMLRVLGFVKAYRYKTGERGESGLAYLWVGPETEFSLEQAEQIAEPVAA